MKKKLKEYLPALPFIAALLLLSCEPVPGPDAFGKKILLGVLSLFLLIVAAVFSYKTDYKKLKRKLEDFENEHKINNPLKPDKQ